MQGCSQLQQLLFRDGTQQFPHRFGFHRRRQQAELIQQALSVPEAPLGQLGHQVHRLWGDVDGFLLSNPKQVLFERLQGDAAEIKALAAAQDRWQHPLGIGGGQHKHHPRWRLLEGFEQGVERCGGEHVAFIHHIDLPARLHRCEA